EHRESDDPQKRQLIHIKIDHPRLYLPAASGTPATGGNLVVPYRQFFELVAGRNRHTILSVGAKVGAGSGSLPKRSARHDLPMHYFTPCFCSSDQLDFEGEYTSRRDAVAKRKSDRTHGIRTNGMEGTLPVVELSAGIVNPRIT